MAFVAIFFIGNLVALGDEDFINEVVFLGAGLDGLFGPKAPGNTAMDNTRSTTGHLGETSGHQMKVFVFISDPRHAILIWIPFLFWIHRRHSSMNCQTDGGRPGLEISI